MAWSFTNLSYGWKIATGIALAGTTIYVAVNTRWRVNQVDVIELALGTHERCLTAGVTPPSFVRSWYSNSYVTTNVPGDAVTNWTAQLYTNVYTNVIGWRTDRAMMVELDAKIKALCPYYANTNSVYDGTTNIIMHTFTGLLTSLDLGDHTNFTAIPAIGTNTATYGPWAWGNYVVAWQERYKMLEALKCVALPSAFDQDISYRRTGSVFDDFEPVRTWAGVETFLNMAITIPTTNYDQWYFDSDDLPVRTYYGNTRGSAYQWPGGNAVWTWGGSFGGSATGVVWRGRSQSLKMEITGPRLFNTNLTIIKSFCQQYIKEESLSNYGQDYYYGYGHNTFWGTPLPDPMREFLSYYSGDEVYTNDSARTVKQWPSNHVVLIDFPTPIFTDLSVITNTARFDYAIGARYTFNAPTSYLFPQFNYCTDAYWE